MAKNWIKLRKTLQVQTRNYINNRMGQLEVCEPAERWDVYILKKTKCPTCNPDSSFVQVNTGEIRGIVVAIHSSVQHKTLFSHCG